MVIVLAMSLAGVANKRSSFALLTRNKPFEALKHDSTATIGHWRPFYDETLALDPAYNTSDELVGRPEEAPDAETWPISAASVAKAAGRTAVYEEDPTPITAVFEDIPPPLAKDELASARHLRAH